MQSSRSFFEQAIRRTGWRPQRQAVTLAVLGAFLALIMGGLYLSQVASEAARGREMREPLTRRDDLERVNEALRVEIAELRKASTGCGGVPVNLDSSPPAKRISSFIVVNGYNPNRGQTVAPLQEVEEQLPVYDESFGGWLQQQLHNLTQQFEQFSEGE
ncbi:MAG: hypothetical protein HND48_14095 [Chloroflexi bacterium]|nr:hypothetical protein [Chloroflexota bacterium]